MGAAFAANSGPAPQLVPYTVAAVAGNVVTLSAGGFSGDNNLALNATMNGPTILAVDYQNWDTATSCFDHRGR